MDISSYFNHPFDIVMLPIQAIIVLFTIYYFVIGFFGLWRFKEEKIKEVSKKLAVIVAAHNESAVIGQLVKNLTELKYPKEMYDVYVIADNCTDNTAEVAGKAGAIVCERFDDTKKSKGYALEWMFDRLFEMEDKPDGKKYDAVVIFDADNLVHPNFLMEMNHHLCKGRKIIQGYLDAKNPYDTWVAGTFAIAFWVIDHIYHLAKTNLGLSAVLGGTGMCITMDVIRTQGWRATCLVEDMEFTMKSLACGIKTTWAHDAIVYDEKPLTFMQSWRQRKRWAQGGTEVWLTNFMKVIRHPWKNRFVVPMMTDTTMSIIWSFFFWITTIIFIISMVCFALQGNYERVYHGIAMSLIYVNFQMIAGIMQVLAALILDFKGVKFKYLLFAPIYLLFTWIVNPLTIVTTFVRAVQTIMGHGSGKWISPKRKVN